MNVPNPIRQSRRRGIALLITMIFLVLFSCMAASITSFSDGSLLVARNESESRQASALALTGVQMIQQSLGNLPVPGTHYAGDMHQAIATQLTTVYAADLHPYASRRPHRNCGPQHQGLGRRPR
jgi:hypothetical protein